VLIEAVAWLLVARLSLIFVSFPRLARRLGTVVAPADARALQAKSDNKQGQARVAEEVGWAVTRAARHVPFNAVCLPQAMAARIMLKRRGVDSVLHFGAKIGQDKPIDAHAWLDAAGVEVTGYPVANTFAEIACFV
jgi:transglutaminase superfamily protein